MRIKFGAIVILLSSLGTALAISGQSDDSAIGVVGAVERSTPTSRESTMLKHESNPGEMHFDLAAIKRTVPKNIQSNEIFRSKSWHVPPVQTSSQANNLTAPSSTASNVPPPPPSAPPLPFAFIGRMIDGNEVTLFLSRNGQQYVVRKNERLDDTYRIEEITSTEATITHLPTNTQQTLLFNSATTGSSALSKSSSSSITQAIPESRRPIELVHLAD